MDFKVDKTSQCKNWRLDICDDIAKINAEQWNYCAFGKDLSSTYNPFISHAFLKALEESGSVGDGTGWTPGHLTVVDSKNRLIGAVPLYIKDHSQGEYVFDFGWADAFERAGGKYYPKIQASIPFTPVTAPKLLIDPDCDYYVVQSALIQQLIRVIERSGFSSLHLTFLPERQWDALGEWGFLKRMDFQYHWKNEGYDSFEKFLGNLTTKKRRNVKRERLLSRKGGIEIEWLSGNDITEKHWDTFFRFYMDTGNRKWGSPYLNRTFFSLLGDALQKDILLIMGKVEGEYIAGALNLIGGDRLYGRYWGCLGKFPYLHFEICYYQAIQFAIEKRLDFVEAGAQGEHKLARGYMARPTYSAHWIAHPEFREILRKYLNQESTELFEYAGRLNSLSPYKK